MLGKIAFKTRDIERGVVELLEKLQPGTKARPMTSSIEFANGGVIYIRMKLSMSGEGEEEHSNDHNPT